MANRKLKYNNRLSTTKANRRSNLASRRARTRSKYPTNTRTSDVKRKRRRIKVDYNDLSNCYIQNGFVSSGLPVNSIHDCVKYGPLSTGCQDTCCGGVASCCITIV